MKLFSLKNLKGKLLIMTIGVMLFSIIFMTLSAMLSVTGVARNQTVTLLMPYAESAADSAYQASKQLVNGIDAMAWGASSYVTESRDTQLAAKTMLDSALGEKGVVAYDIVDALTGSLWFRTVSSSITSEDCFKQAKAGHATMSTPFTYTDGSVCVYICAPIKNDNGTVTAVLAAVCEYSVINNVIAENTLGEDGRTYLFDTTGRVFSSLDTEDITSERNLLTPAEGNKTDAAFAKVAQEFIDSSDESSVDYYADRIVAFAKLDDGRIIAMTAPVSDYNGGVSKAIVICIILGIVCLAIGAVFTAIYSNSIVNPITTSINRIKLLSEGNLSAPVEVSSQKNEIGVLSFSIEETVFSLKKYIDCIKDALNKIAEGNLSFEMEGNFKGDFVQIKDSFDSILASLRDTFSKINTAAEEVNSGAGQVSNGAQMLSQGATKQASAIDELSSQMLDISHQVDYNAEAARNAEKIVENTTQQIASCNEYMIKMLASMDDINRSSNEIGKIIKVIDDIAFQTNILSLNAAVEAARAGSAGKGFAVVADEVRMLATKSAEAVKQTTELIQGSISTVSKGAKIAKSTASSLDAIITSASSISEQVKLISQASETQAESIKQVNIGVDQISAVVQNNTATAEESAAASEELNGQSNALKGMISRFRLSSSGKKRSAPGDDYYGAYSSPAPARKHAPAKPAAQKPSAPSAYADYDAPPAAASSAVSSYSDYASYDSEPVENTAPKSSYADYDAEPVENTPASSYADYDAEPVENTPASSYADYDAEPVENTSASSYADYDAEPVENTSASSYADYDAEPVENTSASSYADYDAEPVENTTSSSYADYDSEPEEQEFKPISFDNPADFDDGPVDRSELNKVTSIDLDGDDDFTSPDSKY